jgi:hypothetical protein
MAVLLQWHRSREGSRVSILQPSQSGGGSVRRYGDSTRALSRAIDGGRFLGLLKRD